MRVHSSGPLYLWLTDGWGRTEGKGGSRLSYLSFCFYIVIFSVSGWLNREVTWVRKDMIGSLGRSCFLEPLAFFFALWFGWKVTSQRCCLLSRRCDTLPLHSLNPHASRVHWNWELRGHRKYHLWRGQQECRRTSCTSLVCTHACSIVPSNLTYKTQAQR